jgi:hypothetical protein
VFISGELTHDEYEGKPQFNVRVGSIDTGPRSEARSSNDGAQASQNQHTTFDDNLDDDVPF